MRGLILTTQKDFKRFNESWIPEPNSGCWLWTGYISKYGYGEFKVKRKTKRASRIALELKLGRPILEGCFSCHKCDTPQCVNPEHLFEGTPQQNTQDALLKGRLQLSPKKTHCRKGHPMSSDDDTYQTKVKKGNKVKIGRTCKACARERSKIRYRKNKIIKEVEVEDGE